MEETGTGSVIMANWESAGVSECEKRLGGNSDLQLQRLLYCAPHDAPVSERVNFSLNFLTLVTQSSRSKAL